MASKIKINFLGTSSQIPTAKRNHISVLLTYEGENILLDCGEGTQRQFRKAKLNPCKVTRILISHWHGDHVLGIPGLLETLAFSGYNKTLFIYGPRGTKSFMKKLLEAFVFFREYPIHVEEVSGKFFETKDFYLEAAPMTHRIPCNAYIFVQKAQIRIDREKLKKANLPNISLLKNLKQGKDVIYEGKKYYAKNLTFLENEKKISFVMDTSMNKKIVPFVKNSDLLICEASFDFEHSREAKKHLHLTTKQAGEIARKAKVKKLILTHISQRYERNLKELLDDAKKEFKNTELVKDLDEVEI